MSHIEFVDDILVYNSVSAVSGLFADTLEIRTGISSPDFDQVKAASANWDSTYLTVSALSAAWNIDYDGSDIKALTANWESTYVVTSGLSADWTTAFNTVCAWGSSSVPDIALRFTSDILGNGIDNTYTYFHGLGTKDLVVSVIEIATGNIALAAVYVTDTQITVEFAEPVSGTLYRLVAIGATNLAQYASISANWQSTFTTVSSNSSNWETTYTTFRDQSGNFLTSETDSQTLSFNESIKELSISNGNNISLSSLDVTGLSANWETTYSLVSSNSSNWESTYTTVSANSSNWETTHTNVRDNSANWESTYTTFRDQSGSFLTSETDSQTLSFNDSNKELSISNGNVVSLSSLDVTSLTASWQSTYSTVSSNSANWSSTYTTVSSNSATWSANPQVIEATVFNADSVTLTRGNVVYSFGATGSTMSVKLASNSGESTSSKALGFVNGNILPGGTGLVTIAGRMENLEFGTPFVDGDALWLGTVPGTYTRTKPSAPNHGVYLGVVERANSGNGIAYVKVQNGYELNEIHDVLITSPLSGQIVRRNSANTLWINTDDASKWDSTYSTVSASSASWNAAASKVFGTEYSFNEQFLNNTNFDGNLLLGTTTGGSLAVATSGVFGQAQLSTGTGAAGSNARLQSGFNQFNVIGNGSLDYAIRFNQSSSVWFDNTSLTGAFRAGLMTSFNTDSTGIYFRAVNGSNLEFISKVGGAETILSLGTLSQGPFHLCQFSINAAGTSIIVKYNGTQVGTVTTNIPTAGLFHNICLIRDSATATAVTANLDFVAMRYVPNTPFFTF